MTDAKSPKRLSPAEDTIARRFVAGWGIKEIAVERNRSIGTIAGHLAEARRKLNVAGRGTKGRSALRNALAQCEPRTPQEGGNNGTADLR